MSNPETPSSNLSTPDVTVTYAVAGEAMKEAVHRSLRRFDFQSLEEQARKETEEEAGEAQKGEGEEATPEDAKKEIEEGITNGFVIFGLTIFVFPTTMILLGVGTITPMFISRNVENPARFISFTGIVGYVLQIVGLITSYFSDRCTSRFGRRKPFIVAGGLLFVVGIILLVLGLHFDSVWVFVVGSWIMSFAGGIVGQANSALVSEVTAKSRLGLVGGLAGLWTALGGFAGLVLVVAIPNRLTDCIIFVAVTAVALLLLILCSKEKPLSPDSAILAPLKMAKTKGEKFRFIIKDFFTSFAFPIKKFPDFFLLLLYRGMITLSSSGNFGQYYLNDMFLLPNATEISALMSIIALFFTLVNSPIFGCVNDRLKRPRITMVVCGFVSCFVTSIYIWSTTPFFPVFLGSTLSGIAAGASASSQMPVTVSVLPSRDKTAQFFAEISFFELIFQTIGTFVIGQIMAIFNVVHPRQSDSSIESSFPSFSDSWNLSSSSSSDGPQPQPQMYTRTGYTVVYAISLGFQAVALIILLFINTGRGRKAQEMYKNEFEKHDDMTEHLLKDVGGEEENDLPSGSDKQNDDLTSNSGDVSEPEKPNDYAPPTGDDSTSSDS